MRRRCLLSLGYMRIIKRGIRLNGVKFEDLRLYQIILANQEVRLLSKTALLRQGKLMRMA